MTVGLSDIFSAASRFVRFHSAMASSASDGRASIIAARAAFLIFNKCWLLNIQVLWRNSV